MRRWQNGPGLLVVAGSVILLLILVLAGITALQTILALPVVLFLPGFALTHLLFPRERLGFPERLLLSLALSVALTVLIGLGLNWSPWGLTAATLWTALLLVLAVEAAVIVFARRLRWRDVIRLPANPNFTARQWVLVSLAVLVTITAFFVALAPVDQQGFEGYTTLWIQPTGVPDTLQLGVNSEEFQSTKYQIRFELNGTVREGPTLELEPGETWEGMLQIPGEELVGNPLTVLLYRLDHPNEVYRHAVWWPETE